MTDLIQCVLDHLDYDGDPTEENLIRCFLDFVDHGKFGNLDYEEALDMINDGELTIKMICYNLLK